MTGGTGRPPRLAEMLLRLVIWDPEAREGILGDLWEEYREAAEAGSQRRASLEYWWTALRLALRFATARFPRLPSHRARVVIPTLGRGRAIAEWARDLGYATRGLGRSPRFTAAATLTLGLALGASATIFGVFDAAVLRPIPLPDPHRLVSLSQVTPQGVDFLVSQPDFVDLRERSSGVLDLAAYQSEEVAFFGDDGLERIPAGFTTSALFRVLGVRPAVGRSFSGREERPGANAEPVILSSRFWTRSFGADPDILGRGLRLDDGLHVVVGVMPPGLELLGAVDVWLAREADPLAERDDRRLRVFGRLRADASLSGAREEVVHIALDLAEQHPASNQGWSARLIPLTDRLVGSQVRLTAVTLLSALALLLLLIGANISNLLLARTSGRQREFGVRSALGAGRGSLVRILLGEGLVIGLVGAMIGVALAYVLLPLVASQPELVPRMSDVKLDWRALTFLAVASAVEGVGIGLGSVIQATRWKVQRALTETGGGATRTIGRYRDALVVGQMALAMTLLVAAGLLARSFRQLQRVDPGFRTEGLLAAEVQLSSPGSRLELPVRVGAVLTGLASIPGVEAVTGTSMRFFDLSPRFFTELGRVDAAVEDYVTADWRVVADGYFPTTEIPLRSGRLFDAGEGNPEEPVVIVGETLARALWPEGDAVGRQLRWEGPEGIAVRVVGVVGDVSDVHPVLPQVASAYRPYSASPTRSLTLLLRSDLPASELAASVRREVGEVDPGAALSEIRAVDDLLADVVALDRFLPSFLAVVAVVAVMLAGLGIYGLVSFTVARRQHEIGIRLTLGGRPDSIVRMLFRHGAMLVAAGVALGAAAALALSEVISSLLFDTAPTDPATYVLVGGFLAVVGLVATYVPSRRATKVDPMKVLPA